MLSERTYSIAQGVIRYWVNAYDATRPTLVFLPGLTADHTLFDEQIAEFGAKYNVLVWDAPGHAQSRPFVLDFSLEQEAQWLRGIVCQYAGEASAPIMIGQSKGGMLAQKYLTLYPSRVAGIVSVDSTPLEGKYFTKAELWMVKHVEPFFYLYPWIVLKNSIASVSAKTVSARESAYKMFSAYTWVEYCRLAGFGFRILAEAEEQQTTPLPKCPILLLIGDEDKVGACQRVCKEWARNEELPLVIVPNARHNSNEDNPEFVNKQIQQFIQSIVNHQ